MEGGREGEWQKESTLVRAKTKNSAPLLQLRDGLDFLSMQGIATLQEKHVPVLYQREVSGAAAHCPLKMGTTQRSEGSCQQMAAGRSHLCACYLLFLCCAVFLSSPPPKALLPKLGSHEQDNQHHLRTH